LGILDRCTRDWELIGSVVIDDEVSLIKDIERRLKVEQKLAIISEYIELNDAVFRQASVYQKAGLKLYDSLHLACAQAGKTIFSHNRKYDYQYSTEKYHDKHPGG